MASFFEGQTSRAQRYRKQQLYKNMLDQQVHYQNLNPESQASKNKFALNKSHIAQPYKNSTSTNMPQPYKRYSYSRNSPTLKSRLLTQPDEGADKYLESCEQIINNLKSLTQKRKQKELELLRLQSKLKPGYKSKKQEEEQVYRYLRSRNSGSMHKNNEQADKKRQKFILKPLKVADPLSNSTYQDKGKSMKVGASKKKLKKILPRQMAEKSHRSLYSREDSKSKSRLKTPQNKNLNPQQKETFDTMIELMKYFKAKQEQMEKQKQKQRQKTRLVNEEVQVDPILDQQPVDNKRQQSNQSQLKLKALMQLRQLNLKSRQLVEKLKKSKSEKNEESKSQQNKNKPKKQHRLKKRLEDEIKKKKMEEEQEKKAKQQSHNEQLLKAINSQLNKQQQQNQSLTSCLKALSQFLKDQNEEIQALKQSQLEAAKKPHLKNKQPPPIKNKNILPPKFRAEQFPKVKKNTPQSPSQEKQQEKPKVQHTKEQQNKLKEAFLKKLKKLRVRSKQFNDKLEPFTKQNQSQNEQNQHSPHQMVSELSESPRDMKLTKQQY